MDLLKRKLFMDIDFRILIVVAPVLAAGTWAVITIFPAALKQIQGILADK
jgi:photosystem II PsbY protein